MAELDYEKYVPLPAPLPDCVRVVPHALVIEGGTGTGKTQQLVARAVALLDEGADPADILFLCATPWAAAAAGARLAGAHERGALVRVATPLQWALDVLSTPAARAATGREARLLAPDERAALVDGLKDTGVRGRRLREMLNFFWKTMTELADLQDGWMVTPEEETVYAALKDGLARAGGTVVAEAANLAYAHLAADADARAAASVAHVLADDYQLMCRASQALACLLAGESMAVAADVLACVEVGDAYPYASGVQEFACAHPHAVHVRLSSSHLCADAAACVNALRADAALGGAAPLHTGLCPAQPAPCRLVCDTPSEEMQSLARNVCALVAGGAAPADIVVAATHPVWARNAARALASRDVPVWQGVPARKGADVGPMPLQGFVRILPLEGLVGITPAHVLVVGFENGLIPSRDYFDRSVYVQEKADQLFARDARLVMMALGKPTRSLTVSCFERAPFEAAERLQLSLARIRMEEGERVAYTQPSEFCRFLP